MTTLEKSKKLITETAKPELKAKEKNISKKIPPVQKIDKKDENKK